MQNLLQPQYFKNGVLYCKFSIYSLVIVNTLTNEVSTIPSSSCWAMLLNMQLSDCFELSQEDFEVIYQDALSIYN